MRKISDTIARLAALQARYDPSGAGSGSPDVLTTLSGFGANPGGLTARYHVPEALPEAAPLVVVLHGCTQTSAAYDHHSGWSKLANESGFALLYPEQQRANNPNLCFNWFQPTDARRSSGEAHSIRQMIETMIASHRLDRKRIFITGLSAGGAMTAAMLASYPEVFAGGAIIAGLPYNSATTVPEAFDRMRGHGGPSAPDLKRALREASDHRGPWPRISIWHGSADSTVAPTNAAAIASQWQDVHDLEAAPTYSKSAGSRTIEVWCDAAGASAIEINMISGMGHGTPLGEGIGANGPYMIDVGISSTREIARFWGIEDSDERVAEARAGNGAGLGARPGVSSHVPTIEREAPRSQHPSATGVKKVIEDALRSAGLMR